ncbi:MAG: SGNH/GDSL hydrolase family protein [Pseudobacter sp.]|uniref:SGNH/GDSL hydrolase family protein n=1 Tax=Pseudobacter sp. TaxID=2045420 RepID=UPI003F7F66E3
MSKGKKLLHRFLYILFFTAVVFIGMEIILRIYNPFQFRLKGDEIVLPVNTTLTIHNEINPKLDSLIVNSRNSLGFRGAEKPADFNSYLSIVTVGGSTTECHFNSDDKTWPAILGSELQNGFRNVWVNNAGLDGHSTFGHQVLLHDHLVKVKPNIVLFLTGVNDIESDQPSFHDQQNKRGAWSDLKHYIVNNSEVLSLLLNLARGWKAQQLHNTSGVNIDPSTLPVSTMNEKEGNAVLLRQQPYLQGYTKRVQQLIDTCTQYGIKPVFITQPLLYG